MCSERRFGDVVRNILRIFYLFSSLFSAFNLNSKYVKCETDNTVSNILTLGATVLEVDECSNTTSSSSFCNSSS